MNLIDLTEKVANPLRKKSLEGHPSNLDQSKQLVIDWINYIKSPNIENAGDQMIRDHYFEYKKKFPERAERWLNQYAQNYANQILRSKVKTGSKKIYEHRGVQVFLDESVTESFDPNSYNMRMLKFSINNLTDYILSILPNRKPRIVITDKNKNPLFKGTYSTNPGAIYSDRIIYIDQYNVDDSKMFIHEYAHYVADLIPKQSEPLLQKAYNEMIDKYWRKAKLKRRKLQADDPSDRLEMQEAEKWRKKISAKLGFPQYGLTNYDEFFAVLIENWKDLPNNTATYQFKSSVKNVLARL